MNTLKTEHDRIMDFISCMGEILTQKQLDKLKEMGYFTQYASMTHHGSELGGLYFHSKTTANILEDLTERLNLKWSRPESPKIIGMFHDLCKCDEYIVITNESGTESGAIRRDNTLLTGHGDKSAILALQLMNLSGKTLTDEEMMCIRYHMGPYEGKEIWKSLDSSIKKYPNILWTMQADAIASKVLNT